MATGVRHKAHLGVTSKVLVHMDNSGVSKTKIKRRLPR